MFTMDSGMPSPVENEELTKRLLKTVVEGALDKLNDANIDMLIDMGLCDNNILQGLISMSFSKCLKNPQHCALHAKLISGLKDNITKSEVEGAERTLNRALSTAYSKSVDDAVKLWEPIKVEKIIMHYVCSRGDIRLINELQKLNAIPAGTTLILQQKIAKAAATKHATTNAESSNSAARRGEVVDWKDSCPRGVIFMPSPDELILNYLRPAKLVEAFQFPPHTVKWASVYDVSPQQLWNDGILQRDNTTYFVTPLSGIAREGKGVNKKREIAGVGTWKISQTKPFELIDDTKALKRELAFFWKDTSVARTKFLMKEYVENELDNIAICALYMKKQDVLDVAPLTTVSPDSSSTEGVKKRKTSCPVSPEST